MATDNAKPARDAAVDLECDDEFEEFDKEWSGRKTGAARDATQWERVGRRGRAE